MTVATSQTGFRRGLVLTSSASVTNLVLLSVETILAARLLPTREYGGYILLLTTVQFLTMAIDFGCKTSVTQLISRGDVNHQRLVVGSALLFRVAVLAIISALIWLFRDLLAIIDPSPDLVKYASYVPPMLITTSLDELLIAILQGFQAYRVMTISQVARGYARVVLSVTLLVVFHWGAAALVASWCVSYVIAIAYEIWVLPVRTGWRVRGSTLMEILSFGTALQLTRFLAFMSARLHVTLLAALAGVDSVAFFAVATRIPDALKTLSDSYFRVYFPTMTSMLASERSRATALFERTLRLGSFAGALSAVFSMVFCREIVTLLFSSKYAASAPVFGLLMIALQMGVMVNVVGTTLIATGRPGRILVMDVAWAAASAVGDLLLIPGLGVVGSGLAAVGAGYLSTPLAMWLAGRSEFSVRFRPYILQSLIMVLCAAAGWWVHPAGLFTGLAFKALVIAIFFALNLRLGTFSLDDVALVVGERLHQRARLWMTRFLPGELLGVTRGSR